MRGRSIWEEFRVVDGKVVERRQKVCWGHALRLECRLVVAYIAIRLNGAISRCHLRLTSTQRAVVCI